MLSAHIIYHNLAWHVSLSIQAAIAKCNGRGGLQKQTFIPQSSGGWQSEIKSPADSVSGENLLAEGHLLLCPHVVTGTRDLPGPLL